ncbi:MAG: hypothetical protein V4669_12385 [Pseudomonadota bacterium]
MADLPGEQHEPALPTQPAEPVARGFSFPYSVPLVLYPVLAIGIAAGAAKWWGWVFIIAAAAAAFFFTHEALSSSQFEAIHAKDPTLNRLTWRINWLVLFALPAAALTTYALLKRLW